MAQQDQKISQLTPKAAVDGTEQIPVAHGGQNYTLTPGQLKQYIGGAVDITDMVSGDTISDENLALLKQYVNEGVQTTIEGINANTFIDVTNHIITTGVLLHNIEVQEGKQIPYIQALFIRIDTNSKQITQSIGQIYPGWVTQEAIVAYIYSKANHGTNDTGTDNTPFALQPFAFHMYDTVDKLNLSLAAYNGIYLDADTVMPEYKFQFTSGTTPTVLNLPSDVKWASSNVIEANHTYQVSIVNNIAVMIGVEETPHSGGSLE